MQIRRLLLLGLCFGATLISLSAQDFSRIGLGLQDKIAQAGSQEFQPVTILLIDQVDIRSMDINFSAKNASLEERTYQVITSLKTKAQTTQGPILDILSASPDLLSGSLKPLWITNVIRAQIRPALVYELSQRPEIEMIEYEFRATALESERVEAEASPNGIENGLAAIKAPFMWKKGYIGYGRKSLTIDTGVDPTHDALKDRFWANFVPLDEAWFSPSNPIDCNDHGTHVTGTILGLNEANNDTIGVAFGAFWMGSAAIDCGPANSLDAFQWAIDPDGNANTIEDMPDVINNSWRLLSPGSEACTGVYVPVFNALEAAGVAVVFAAGNNGFQGVGSIQPPGVINTDLVNVFSVGNVNGNVASFPLNTGSSQGPTPCGGLGSLLIKPEVSAPGTNVRSAVNGNGYSSFTGTSMASPHVAGAILLLKEAFPALTGTEIKLALYFSADDLGVAGEDNLYGMGIINLEAAYNYLINEGNVPAVIDTLDLVNLSLYEEGGFVVCEENFELEVAFTYQGADPLPGAKLAYSLNQASFDTLDWVGTLMPGDTVYTSILLSNLSPGDYDVKTTILDNNGVLEYLFVNNSRRLEFSVSDDPHVANVVDSVCITRQSLVLAPADSPYQTLWFSNRSDPLPFHIGSSYLTPPIVSEQVYYTNAGFYGKGGVEAWDGTNGGYDPSNTTTMTFDMHREATLYSVTVYAASAGPRAIYLLDASGGNVNSKFSSLQAGENEVVLDFVIPAGQGYQLRYGLVPNLYKQDSGATYPYEIDDLATITGNSNQDDAYYYFYDWQFIFEGACVRGTAKTTPVAGAAFAVFTLPDTIYTATVDFTDASLLAVSWEWDFGDGTTSTDQSPVHTYADTGTYAISLRVRGVEGCSDVLLDTITVIPRPLAIGDPLSPSPLMVFPNPGSGLFHARLPQAGRGKTQLQVFNQWGQQIAAPIAWEAQDLSWQIDLSAYPAGVYYLSIQQAEQAYRAVLVRN